MFGKVDCRACSSRRARTDKQLGVYIQDDWAVNEHLTLNLGVRWDYEKNPAYLDYCTPANVVDAINAPNSGSNGPTVDQSYAQSLALGGININDYISTGNNRTAPKDEFQPRFGFSYDLGGDEQHVIFGGIGRAYDRNLFDYLSWRQTKRCPLPQINFENSDRDQRLRPVPRPMA